MSNEATSVDILIVGAGIAGTTLALELHKRGAKIAIIDAFNPYSSSRVAAGMMNPMVPRNVQKTWHCDDLFPQVFEYYGEWEQKMNAKFIHAIPTLQVHKNESHTKNWSKRSREKGFTHHLTAIDPDGLIDENSNGEIEKTSIQNKYGIPLPFGAAITELSGKLDVSVFLECAKNYLINHGVLWISDQFEYSQLNLGSNVYELGGLKIASSETEMNFPFDNSNYNSEMDKSSVVDTYECNSLKFEKLVFAQGVGMFENPWFNYLPLNATGGDLITLEFEDLPQNFILKRKEWLVPIGNNRWIGGSTYHKNSLTTLPQQQDLTELLHTFSEWIPKTPKVVGHIRAARPTVETWRPFLGQHPKESSLYVYNGLGSKGSSLVVMLSPMYADFLMGRGELMSEVDIKRIQQQSPS